MKEVELAIIGAGPAGLAAATEAAFHGLAVTLIDDNRLPGGQYFRQAATESLRAIAGRLFDESAKGKLLLSVVERPGVDYRNEAVVFGFFDDGTLTYVQGDAVRRLRPRCLILAAGATERPVPFPGWTLPGVMGAGAVQNMMKSQRVIPGRRILIAGNGPLMLLAAANLARLGANVIEVVEAARPRRRWRQIPGLLAEPAILARGVGYRARLVGSAIPFRSGQVVVEARGGDRVEEAVVAPIDRAGGIDRGRARVLAIDTLIVGFGLVPATEMSRALGCAQVYDPGKGGWTPVRSPDLETTRPNVFAAGVENALLEGRLAGLVAAARLGRVPAAAAADDVRRLRARLARLGRFRRAIERLYEPPQSFLSLLGDDTIVCRCEEATAREVADQLADGVTETNSLKAVTRVGMGRCQGRNCLSTVAAMIARQRGCSLAEIPLPTPRPPMRPVGLASLLNDAAD